VVLPALFLASVLAAGLLAQTPSAPQLTADELFNPAKVWTVHLTMNREAFAKLTPQPAPPMPPPLPPAGRGAAAGAPPPPPPPPVQMQVPSVLPPEMLKMAVAGFLGPEGGRNGISAQRGIEFEYVHAAFEMEGRRFADVAVRAKGNGTFTPVARFPKPSVKIDLNKYVKGQKLGGVSTINLHNNITDASWMNEALAFRLYRDAGLPAPRTSWAKLYVTVTGGEARKYLGLYSLVENVDDDFTESRFKVEGGALLKPVTTVPFMYLTRNWADYNQMYDPKTDLGDADRQRIIDFCDLLSNAPDPVFARRIGEFLDLEAFAKYMAVVVWMANPDSVLRQGQNYYVHMHPTSKRFVFLPWDQDHSFGQFVPWSSPESQQQLDILRPWSNRFQGAPFAAQLENKLLARTFALPGFRTRYLAEMAALTRTVTDPARLSKQVDDVGALLAPHVAGEPRDGRIMSFAEALRDSGTYRRPVNEAVVVVPIKVFVKARQASVLAQLHALGVR
jgi:hypothetical protein